MKISLIILCGFLPLFAALTYEGPLPDFNGDANNRLLDCETGTLLNPGLPGEGFEFASPTAVDWNNDGLFDLLVGYNLQTPDSLKLVVFINHGTIGEPRFTGRASDTTCFFVNVKYPGQTGFRPFAALGYHPTEIDDNHRFMGFVPSVFDWNHDGKFDIFITEGTCDNTCGCCGAACTTLWNRRGNWLLINTGTPGQPEFGNLVNANYNPFNTGYAGCTITNSQFQGLSLFQAMSCNGNFPQAILLDWNNDDIMDISYAVKWTDIIFGDTTATGQWKPKNGAWTRQSASPDSGFGHHPLIRAADFNHDGKNELLSTWGQDGVFSLFVSNPDTTSAEEYVKDSTVYRKNVVSWHPKYDIVDYDEDGYWDVLAGWGRGNGETPQPGIWYYRSTVKGVPGSHPFSLKFNRVEKSSVARTVSPLLRLSSSPNPSRNMVDISWSSGAQSPVTIEICGINGKIVKTLTQVRGDKLRWNGAVGNGVYLIRLRAGNAVAGGRHVVIK